MFIFAKIDVQMPSKHERRDQNVDPGLGLCTIKSNYGLLSCAQAAYGAPLWLHEFGVH
jgi:hypothetical protein